MKHAGRTCRRAATAAAITLTSLALTACAVDAPEPQPTPRAAPSDAPVRSILISTDTFSEDSDGNRFYDTFTCVVYLFAAPEQSNLPMHRSGRMSFELRDEENYSIASWTLSSQDLAQVAGVYNGLPGYFLSLNIAEVADDRVISKRAELHCTFHPDDGAPAVRARPVLVQQIGPIGPGALRG